MTTNSVLLGGALRLTQNYIYRARMLIKAPGALATEGRVRSALEEQGFRDVQFFDKNSLPADWPVDQREDTSGAFSWTAYLQGRFSLTDRPIALSELPGTVEVNGMWTYLVPTPVSPAGPPPSPSGPPPSPASPPSSGGFPAATNVGSASAPGSATRQLLAAAGGVLAGFTAVRWFTHHTLF